MADLRSGEAPVSPPSPPPPPPPPPPPRMQRNHSYLTISRWTVLLCAACHCTSDGDSQPSILLFLTFAHVLLYSSTPCLWKRRWNIKIKRYRRRSTRSPTRLGRWPSFLQSSWQNNFSSSFILCWYPSLSMQLVCGTITDIAPHNLHHPCDSWVPCNAGFLSIASSSISTTTSFLSLVVLIAFKKAVCLWDLYTFLVWIHLLIKLPSSAVLPSTWKSMLGFPWISSWQGHHFCLLLNQP